MLAFFMVNIQLHKFPCLILSMLQSLYLRTQDLQAEMWEHTPTFFMIATVNSNPEMMFKQIYFHELLRLYFPFDS